VLIPKKDDPKLVSNYRLISLSHNFAKVVSKLLANRLALELEDLISVNQTAFIKKQCIHDNFMYVQEVIKHLHKRKIPFLFIKLDISKAFDTVNWAYLLTLWSSLVLLRNGESGYLPCGAQLLLPFWLMVCLGKGSFIVGGELG
jgi:hypothetical protein